MSNGTYIKVVAIGNLGADPEIRSFPDGTKVANFSIATSETWKDKQTGERKSKTEWHRVAVINKGLVGIIDNYVKKGSKVLVEGKLQTRSWTDREGVTRYTTEIVLTGYQGRLELMDKKPQGDDKNSTNDSGNMDDRPKGDFELDDEIPF